MDGPEDPNPTDVVLLPFLRSSGHASEAHLSDLIAAQTETTIKGIIRSTLRVSLSVTDGSHDNQEALELLSEVQAVLLESLRELQREASSRTIANLHGYVATATFNACHQWLRRKYPQRLRLKNKLRYLLTHVPEFALWETDDRQWLCGFALWREGRPEPVRLLTRGRGRESFIELLTSIFTNLKKPALLDDVVTLAAESLGIKDGVTHGDAGLEQAAAHGGAVVAPAGILTELEQRAELQRVWSAICELPQRHRVALLLNLRDRQGADALEFLPLTHIATIGEIARVLGFAPEDFARVWNDLPWDDLRIAKHLGLSRQQVINLRQSARARLARELNAF